MIPIKRGNERGVIRVRKHGKKWRAWLHWTTPHELKRERLLAPEDTRDLALANACWEAVYYKWKLDEP